MEVVLQHFGDAAGGFFFTSDDHEKLIHRPKTFSDDATPSGNGIAAYVLQRLGHLLGEPRYLSAAEGTLRAAWADLARYPQSHATLLSALEELLHPPQIVIIRGAAEPRSEWQAALARLLRAARLVLAIPEGMADLPAALTDKAGRPEHDRVRVPRQRLFGTVDIARGAARGAARRRIALKNAPGAAHRPGAPRRRSALEHLLQIVEAAAIDALDELDRAGVAFRLGGIIRRVLALEGAAPDDLGHAPAFGSAP